LFASEATPNRRISPIITAMKISWPIKAIVMETTPLIGFVTFETY
jgi:hypothetical protein